MDFDDLLKKAIGLLRAKKKLASLVQVEKGSQKVEDLVEKYNCKTRISLMPNRLLTQPPISIYQPLILFFLLIFQLKLTAQIIDW